MITKAEKTYEHTPDRRAYKKQWMKDNTKTIIGLRPIMHFDVILDDKDGHWHSISPCNFLVAVKRIGPYLIYGTNTVVHVPRSLCRRARITINTYTNKIISRGEMKSANDCT